MDMNEILKKAKEVQDEMKKSQAEAKNKQYQGEAGGSLVKVIINGANEVKKVYIDPSLMKNSDDETNDAKDIIEDLLVAAFNDALKKASEDGGGSIRNIAKNMGLPTNLF